MVYKQITQMLNGYIDVICKDRQTLDVKIDIRQMLRQIDGSGQINRRQMDRWKDVRWIDRQTLNVQIDRQALDVQIDRQTLDVRQIAFRWIDRQTLNVGLTEVRWIDRQTLDVQIDRQILDAQIDRQIDVNVKIDRLQMLRWIDVRCLDRQT